MFLSQREIDRYLHHARIVNPGGLKLKVSVDAGPFEHFERLGRRKLPRYSWYEAKVRRALTNRGYSLNHPLSLHYRATSLLFFSDRNQRRTVGSGENSGQPVQSIARNHIPRTQYRLSRTAN